MRFLIQNSISAAEWAAVVERMQEHARDSHLPVMPREEKNAKSRNISGNMRRVNEP